ASSRQPQSCDVAFLLDTISAGGGAPRYRRGGDRSLALLADASTMARNDGISVARKRSSTTAILPFWGPLVTGRCPRRYDRGCADEPPARGFGPAAKTVSLTSTIGSREWRCDNR